jgi:membrane-associated phospholipid phosphatase
MRSKDLATSAAEGRPGGRPTRRSRRDLAAGGLGCLVLVVLLGLVVGPHANGPDRHVKRILREPLDERPYQRAVRVLATETGWPHAAYVMAALPVALAGALVAYDLRLRGRQIHITAWRWLLPLLLALPAQHLLRVLFDRAGPNAPFWSEGTRGAYPSGAALAVALGWAVGGVIAGDLRPRWRPVLLAAAACALGLHALARVAAQKHWATDIVGSYLLAGGALLCAAAARPTSGR